MRTHLVAVADRISVSGGQAVGLTILLALGLGIIIGGVKAKQTKPWELIVIGSTGFLIGSTALGPMVRTLYGGLGGWLVSLIA